MSENSELFVGVDWAKRKHDAVLVAADGSVMDHLTFEHDSIGFEKLHRWIDARDVVPGSINVAIETPHGSVVASCLLRGYRVFALNPKQLDRFRDRYFMSGAKDDRRDAEVLARSLRTDLQSFRAVRPPAESHRVLEETLKLHDELVEQRIKLLNRFGELVHEYFPQFEEGCSDLGASWVLAFWKIAKTSRIAQSLSEKQVADLLKKYRVRRIDAKQLLERVRSNPLPLLPGVERACVMHIEVCIDQLELLNRHLRKSELDLRKLIDSLRGVDAKDETGNVVLSDVDIIESLPGAGPYVTAALLVEAKEELEARDFNRMRAVAGLSPVTKQSGNKRSVVMRRACRPLLRNAVYHLARVAVIQDDELKARYAGLRADRKTHGLALRIVANTVLRALVSMLKNRTTWRSTAESKTDKASA